MSDTTYKVKRCFWYQQPHEHDRAGWTFGGMIIVTCPFIMKDGLVDGAPFEFIDADEFEEREGE